MQQHQFKRQSLSNLETVNKLFLFSVQVKRSVCANIFIDLGEIISFAMNHLIDYNVSYAVNK
jgi:hypothetical protein